MTTSNSNSSADLSLSKTVDNPAPAVGTNVVYTITLTNHNHAPVDSDGKIKEKWSFRRSNYFKFVGEECLNVMNGVGIQDMSAFAKMEV